MKNQLAMSVMLSLLSLAPVAAHAAVITETGPNDSFSQPMMITTEHFTLDLNSDIISSQTIPWVSVLASGENHFDYFSFSIMESGAVGMFDIDHAFRQTLDLNTGKMINQPMDSMLHLFDSTGKLLQTADDSLLSQGADGSLSTYDPYLEYAFATPGTYVIGMGRYLSGPDKTIPGGLVGDPLRFNDYYTLQISLQPGETPPPVPIPGSLWLLGSACAALLGSKRRDN